MSSRGFYTITLGCKLNQFDSAAIEGELSRRGFRPQAESRLADVVVINTCTVTHKADADARKLIRSVRRANRHCKLIVTGCYAELEPQRLRELGGIDRVFGNRDKPRLGAILDELGLVCRSGSSPSVSPTRDDAPSTADRGCDAALSLPDALHFGDRSRAFLKVQEGCRLACAYCIIPRVRGASRSVPAADVERTLRSLHANGYREIVLTGVNTGDYGRDLEPRTDLAGLLRRLLAVDQGGRLRLNSLEPLTITDEIIELIAGERRIASHLQVPLQSGSPAILRRMRRNYDVETYLDRLLRLRRAVPDIGLGADVIVGFPGESAARFEETYACIAGSPLSYLHVFSWSPRPGTPAAAMPDRVDARTIRSRSTRLRELASRKSLEFRRRFEGRRLDAVMLGPDAAGGRGMRALTGNFIEVTLPDASARPREIVEIEIDRATSGRTTARVTGIPGWAGPRPLQPPA